MRAVLLLAIVAIVLIVGAIATGFLNLREIRGAQTPELVATRSSVTAKGGRPPAFDVQTGTVKVGSKETKVKLPTLEVRKPDQNQSEEMTNRTM
jgi:hypothetical protein